MTELQREYELANRADIRNQEALRRKLLAKVRGMYNTAAFCTDLGLPLLYFVAILASSHRNRGLITAGCRRM
jgi:hypothetical protein